MENNTNTKPIKIIAGMYKYRGIIIRKHKELGFVYTVNNDNPKSNWRYGGMRTLAYAMQQIDERIASGDYAIEGSCFKQLNK